MNRIAYIICAAMIAVASLSACGATAPTTAAQPSPSTPAVANPSGGTTSPSPVASPSGAPLVTIKTNGGMCVNGACWSTTEIAADGTYHAADGTGTDRSGALDAAQAAALADLVAKADFAAIKSRPFTGTCPIAYDGQELIFTFHTTAGDETIATCQVEVDPAAPLFQALDQALATIRQ